MSEAEVRTADTPEQLDELTDYTVVVSAPADLDGAQVSIAAQKIGGDWYTVGVPFPTEPKDFTPAFFPATVVHTQ